MKTFDPWTAKFDEAVAAQGEDFDSGPDGALYQWNAAREIEALRPSVENGDGFAVLDAVSRCARHDLVMPAWLVMQFLRRYEAVLNCRAGSWDAVFGLPYPKRTRLGTLRQRRMMRWELWSFFNASDAPPRTDAGWRAAAVALGITPRQAEEWTPKTRRNTKGHKAYGRVRHGDAPAHDPFSLTAQRKKPG